jgi:hypothetical protein
MVPSRRRFLTSKNPKVRWLYEVCHDHFKNHHSNCTALGTPREGEFLRCAVCCGTPAQHQNAPSTGTRGPRGNASTHGRLSGDSCRHSAVIETAISAEILQGEMAGKPMCQRSELSQMVAAVLPPRQKLCAVNIAFGMSCREGARRAGYHEDHRNRLMRRPAVGS